MRLTISNMYFTLECRVRKTFFFVCFKYLYKSSAAAWIVSILCDVISDAGDSSILLVHRRAVLFIRIITRRTKTEIPKNKTFAPGASVGCDNCLMINIVYRVRARGKNYLQCVPDLFNDLNSIYFHLFVEVFFLSIV